MSDLRTAMRHHPNYSNGLWIGQLCCQSNPVAPLVEQRFQHPKEREQPLKQVKS